MSRIHIILTLIMFHSVSKTGMQIFWRISLNMCSPLRLWVSNKCFFFASLDESCKGKSSPWFIPLAFIQLFLIPALILHSDPGRDALSNLHWGRFVWMACIMWHHPRFGLSSLPRRKRRNHQEGRTRLSRATLLFTTMLMFLSRCRCDHRKMPERDWIH